MIFMLLGFVSIGVCLFAFVDALVRPKAAWIFVGESRPKWLAITGAALLFSLTGFFSILGIAAIVAAMVYILDRRPKLMSYSGPRTPSPWS